MNIVQFPDRGFHRRALARRPRNSKNGSPEQRAASAAPAAIEPPRKRRNSKNGSPEARAAKIAATSAKIVPLFPAQTAAETYVAADPNPNR